MAITVDDFSKIWASTSPLTPYEFSEDNYKSGWNFVGGTPPSRQMWDFLQKNNDEKMQYLANNYLPLSGGTMTSNIAMSRSVDDLYLQLNGGTSQQNGAFIRLQGKDNIGQFQIHAQNGETDIVLLGNPNGTLYWNGKILSANGGRLKSASGTMALAQGSYVDIASVTLEKNVSDKWIVVGWSSLTTSVNSTFTMILRGITNSWAVRYNGSGGGGASLVLAKTITEDTDVYVSVYSPSGTPSANGVIYAFPIM